MSRAGFDFRCLRNLPVGTLRWSVRTWLRTFLVQIRRADATMQRVWGRVHNDVGSRNLNSYLRNYAFSRTELVGKGRIISRYPLLPYSSVHFWCGARRHPEPALAVGRGPRPYLLPQALNSGLVLREKSSVVPDFSESSRGIVPSRALAHVACPLSP